VSKWGLQRVIAEKMADSAPKRNKKKRKERESNDASYYALSVYHNNQPDFAMLAQTYPDSAFSAKLIPYGKPTHTQTGKEMQRVRVDWKDPEAQLALTQVLLKHDFGLEFTMPPGHLCPPVTQRLHYLLWVAHVVLREQSPPRYASISSSSSSSSCAVPVEKIQDALSLIHAHRPIRAIDIGTGASCIFPLLAHACYGWKAVGTEISEESLVSIRANIAANGLQGRIEAFQQPRREALLAELLARDDVCYDVSMCNPPFFDLHEDASELKSRKRVCRATDGELKCPGGEMQFLRTMINESREHPLRVRWYTSMLGKKTTFKAVSAVLKALADVQEVKSTFFDQGQIRRWGVAWTFHKANAEEKGSSSSSSSKRTRLVA
jgi:23S rRNA A1618 N6-methylase RlmF